MAKSYGFTAVCRVVAMGMAYISHSHAVEPSIVHVVPLDPELKVEELAGPHVEVHPLSSLPGEQRGELPSRAQRNRVIASAGLSGEVSSWDEFGKDMLYLRARSVAFEQLAKRYPKVSRGALQKFQRLVRQEESQ